ncbi:MAG: hypothetical protein WBP58_12650 [Chitinophagaceae bacterium]
MTQTPQPGPVTKLSWKLLEDVTYILKWNDTYNLNINYPIFGDKVKKVRGKTCSISGYMIPLDVQSGLYAVSRYNYASCFFCGQSGPESVVSIKFKGKPKRYRTDQFVTIQGLFQLNGTNLDEFMYILAQAEEVAK